MNEIVNQDRQIEKHKLLISRVQQESINNGELFLDKVFLSRKTINKGGKKTQTSWTQNISGVSYNLRGKNN